MNRVPILCALALLAACGSGGGGGEGAHVSACARTAMVSVSPVNGWPGIDAKLAAMELEARCQAIQLIEAIPYFDRSGPCDKRHPDLCIQTYAPLRRAYLKAMSAHGVTVVVTTQNSNAAGPWTWTEEQFRQHVISIREDALEAGIEHVWLGTPSEPNAGDQTRGRARAEIARQEWPGVLVMPARTEPKIMPWFSGIHYDYLEVHPGSVAKALFYLGRPEPLLVVTDNATLLVPSDAALRDITRKALRLIPPPPVIFYDNLAFDLNLPAIGAITDEIFQSTGM